MWNGCDKVFKTGGNYVFGEEDADQQKNTKFVMKKVETLNDK